MRDIAEWLEGQGFGEYAEAFARNKIDRDVLPSLTGEDLKEMGVATVGDRRRLLDAIAVLSRTHNARHEEVVEEPVARARSPEEVSAERRQLTVMCAPYPSAAADCSALAAPELDWSDCSKSKIMIPSSELEGANLHSTNFSGTDLSKSNLKTANLGQANLVRASLAGADAQKANFSEVEAYRCNFADISAVGASFTNAELQRANFRGAKLTGASFEKAELGRADFDQAVLTGVRFSLADLSRADLSHATFEGSARL